MVNVMYDLYHLMCKCPFTFCFLIPFSECTFVYARFLLINLFFFSLCSGSLCANVYLKPNSPLLRNQHLKKNQIRYGHGMVDTGK